MRLNALTATALFCLLTTTLFSNIYIVTQTAGNGWGLVCNDPWNAPAPGTFTQALCDARANPGRDTIRFNLAGGTIISAAKNPFPLDATDNDLLIDGFSMIDNNPIVFNFELTLTGSDIDLLGLSFQTVNHSVTITGSNNSVSRCRFATSGVGQNSVWVNGGTGTLVEKSFFTASQLHAVSIENGGSHVVDSCVTTGINDVAIIARGTGNNVIKNCVVSAGNHNGIGLISGNNLVDSCTAFNNARAGIVCDNTGGTASNNRISHNVIYGNNKNFWMSSGVPTPDQAGIQSDGASTIVENNWVYSNEANGILINKAGGSNSIIRNNIVGRDKNGNELGNGWNGIFVWQANGVTVRNNISVNNGKGSSHEYPDNASTPNKFSMPDRISGIRVQEVTSGLVDSNYIGTDASKVAAGNDFDGITLHTNVSGVTLRANVICNNGLTSIYGNGGGVALRNNANNNTMESNYVGMHKDLSDGGNNDYGIDIEGCSGNIIGGNSKAQGNYIGYSKHSGNQGCGIWIVLAGANNNEVYNNTITNNTGDGVLIERGANNNKIGVIGKGNVINSNENGINVKENGTGPVHYNSLRGNSFSCNTVKGIALSDKGNDLYAGIGSNKKITTNSTESRPTYVSGTAPANGAVDIYVADQNCSVACDNNAYQGATFVTTVTADANGFWEYDFSSQPTLNKTNVVAMVTDTVNSSQMNSSEFSVCQPMCVKPMNITINGNNGFCPGGQVTLTANSFGLLDTTKYQSRYQYTWYKGSVNNANIIKNALTDSMITVNQGDDYYVIITDTVDSVSCSDQGGPFTVTAHQNPTPKVDSVFFCQGESATMKVNLSGMNYLWSPNNETTQEITVSKEGMYKVTVTDPTTTCSGVDSAFADENNNPNPKVTLGPDTSICKLKNQTVDLAIKYTALPGGKISWINGATDSIVTFSDTINVWAMYTDTLGCKGTDTLKIANYCKPPEIKLPNVFVPNGKDNPVFTPFGNVESEDILESEFIVYNRWGRKVFEVLTPGLPKWDGKINGKTASSGTYYWIWIYKDVTLKTKQANGFVQLID